MKNFLLLMLILFATQTFAEELTLGVPMALPPFVLKETNSGIELDIVREILEKDGYEVRIIYMPFGRLPWAMKNGIVDAAMTIMNPINDVHLSNRHISYQNVAVSRKESNIEINNISDLADHKVLAFYNAIDYLGEEFKQICQNNSNYKHIASQFKQVKKFFQKRTDIIILDVNIFNYFRQQQVPEILTDVDIHYIFPESKYSVAFKDPTIKDKFNLGLAEIIESGRYKQIFKHYISEDY